MSLETFHIGKFRNKYNFALNVQFYISAYRSLCKREVAHDFHRHFSKYILTQYIYSLASLHVIIKCRFFTNEIIGNDNVASGINPKRFFFI